MNQFHGLDRHHPILTRFLEQVRRIDLVIARRVEQVDREIEMARITLHQLRMRELDKQHQELALAFCLGSHARLGGLNGCHMQSVPSDLFPYILSLSFASH